MRWLRDSSISPGKGVSYMLAVVHVGVILFNSPTTSCITIALRAIGQSGDVGLVIIEHQ